MSDRVWWYIEAFLFFVVLVWILAMAVMGCGPSTQPATVAQAVTQTTGPVHTYIKCTATGPVMSPTETCVTVIY